MIGTSRCGRASSVSSARDDRSVRRPTGSSRRRSSCGRRCGRPRPTWSTRTSSGVPVAVQRDRLDPLHVPGRLALDPVLAGASATSRWPGRWSACGAAPRRPSSRPSAPRRCRAAGPRRRPGPAASRLRRAAIGRVEVGRPGRRTARLCRVPGRHVPAAPALACGSRSAGTGGRQGHRDGAAGLRPWCRSAPCRRGSATIGATIAMPSPLPPLARLRALSARQNRSKTCAASSGGRPGPASITCSTTSAAPRGRAAPGSARPARVCMAALVARLISTRSSWSRSPSTLEPARTPISIGRSGWAAGHRAGRRRAARRRRPARGAARALVAARQHQQVLDQPGHPGALGLDPVERIASSATNRAARARCIRDSSA